MANRKGETGRHQARKRAVDLLFEAEARGMSPTEAAEARAALSEANPEVSPLNPYTVTVVRGVTDHAAHIDDLITSHLQGWTLERLPAVDRAVLRVAVWELLHADDVPAPVAVDEAVELAKELSTDESPGFVNGVLGHVMLVIVKRPLLFFGGGLLRAGVLWRRLEASLGRALHPGAVGQIDEHHARPDRGCLAHGHVLG